LRNDRERWDSRYSEEFGDTLSPDPLLTACSELLTSGRALDLACGQGTDSIFLARRGYWVDALDISLVALQRLRRQSENERLTIGCVIVDLDYYPLPVNFYDLITVFHFFSVNLTGQIRSALKQDGLLIYATYNYRHIRLRPNFCIDYLVPTGGLGQFFTGLKKIIDVENTGLGGNISQFVGRNT